MNVELSQVCTFYRMLHRGKNADRYLCGEKVHEHYGNARSARARHYL